MFKKFLLKTKEVAMRIRNPRVATSTVSFILMILVNTHVIDAHMSSSILAGFNSILSILVGLGIFSNPVPKKQTPVQIVKEVADVVEKVADVQPAPVQPVAPAPTNPEQPVNTTQSTDTQTK